MWGCYTTIISVLYSPWFAEAASFAVGISWEVLSHFIKTLWNSLVNLPTFSLCFLQGVSNMTFMVNRGIPFAPLVACWMFIVASIVVAMPGLKRVLTFRFTRDLAEVLCRLAFPVITYHFIWIPVNQFFCIKLSSSGMDSKYRAQWLPFLSGMLAVLVVLGTIVYKNPSLLGRLGICSRNRLPRPVSVPGSPRKLQHLTPVRLTPPNPRKEWRNDGPWIIALTPARRVLPMRQHKLTRTGTIYG